MGRRSNGPQADRRPDNGNEALLVLIRQVVMLVLE